MPSNEKRRRSQYRQAGIVLVLLLLLAGGVYAYAKYREVWHLLPVTFVNDQGQESERFYLEIASTPSEREKGLMFRRSMDRNRGMLFIFPREEPRGFWMKNTYLSLDMIFLDRDMQVIGMIEKTPPLSEARQSVPGSSQYVVELLGGRAKESGIQKGSKLKLHGMIPKPM